MTSAVESATADNPFASGSGRGRNLALAAALMGAALLVVIVITVYGRGKTGAPASSAHVHGSRPAVSQSAPVLITAEAARRIGVTFAPVAPGPVAREIRTVAQVTFDETRVRIVSTKIDGWVEQLHVDFTGQSVAAGQALLSVYSPMLVSAQEELLLASRLTRSLSDAATEVRAGSSDLTAAVRRRLLNWDISAAEIDRIERTGQVRRHVTLRSPVSGVVIGKDVLGGQKIMAGQALYKVADLSQLWLEGEVFERDLRAVHQGTQVRAEFDALPGEIRTGRVSFVSQTLDPETRTARVRVSLRNPGMRLKPGMYATIRIEGIAEPAVSVPRSAVLSTGERTLVFVLRKDGMLEPRQVTVGESSDDRTRIISGVNVGESVVASATFLVDAESNLGSSLGGMGDMPGMDITSPSNRKE